MKRVLCLLLVLVGVGLGAQTSLTPAPNLLVKSDSNGYLLVTPAQSTAPLGPLTPFNTIRLRTDSNGFLMTALAVGAGIDGTVPPGVAVGSVLVSAGVGLQGLWSASPTLTSVLVGDGLVSAPPFAFASEPGLGPYRIGAATYGIAVGGARIVEIGSSYLAIRQDAGQLMLGAAVDVVLNRDAANILAQRNGTNAQAFRLYNTTDAPTTNFERVNFTWSEAANRFRISSTKGGTGTARPIDFTDGATALLTIDPVSATVLARSLTVQTSNGVGLGYSTGAGGTVTQITSKATGVTLNTYAGQITLNNAALLAGAKVSFVVTDSAFAATDIAVPCVVSGGTANAYRVSHTASSAGTFTLTVENITAGSLSEAPVIGYVIVKGVIS